MSTMPAGHIELERAVDSITVGRRHRHDLGDLAPLTESIRRSGLLQPVTVTPDGQLVCGARRLAAIRQLRWKTVNVWVRSGVSDRLGQLLAEQDDNQLHKPLTQLEAAGLYRELKALLAEDASRRQKATRFHPSDQGAECGGDNLTPPHTEPGKTRSQAATMVTGRDSHTTLERIGRLEDLAADPDQPDHVRRRAAAELDQIKAGAAVYPSHLRMNTELTLAGLDRIAADPTQLAQVREQARADAADLRRQQDDAKAAELEQLAHDALARITADKTRRRGARQRRSLTVVDDDEPIRFPLTAFIATWDDLVGWWLHYDPAEVGPALTDEQWERFEATITATVAFTDTARTARHTRAEHIA